MENVTFSEVKRVHGLLRFLWPVQSLAQVKAIALIYAAVLPLIALVVYLYGDPPSAIWWSLVGFALGGSGSLFMNLPGALELTTRSEARHYIDELSGLLRRLGYAEDERSGCCLHFAGRTAPWMRWFPYFLWWKQEIGIDLSARDHTITLQGPKSILNIVKHRGERDALGGAHDA
jgi:hypothetical protein